MTERIVYQGKIIEVVEFDVERNGKTATYERARRAPGTRTLVVSSQGNVLLSREHRQELGGYDYRLPGGKVFDTLEEYNQFLATKPDQKTIIAEATQGAIRELREEAGLSVTEAQLEFRHLAPCGATVDWDLYYFIARVDSEDLAPAETDEHEIVEAGWHTPEEALVIVLNPKQMQEDRSAAFLLRELTALLRV